MLCHFQSRMHAVIAGGGDGREAAPPGWEWRRRQRRTSVTRRLVPGGGGHATAIESTRGDRGPLTSNRTATLSVSGFRNLGPVRSGPVGSGPVREATETCEATSVTGVWTPPRVSRSWG